MASAAGQRREHMVAQHRAQQCCQRAEEPPGPGCAPRGGSAQPWHGPAARTPLSTRGAAEQPGHGSPDQAAHPYLPLTEALFGGHQA